MLEATHMWQSDNDIGVSLPPVNRFAYRQWRDGQRTRLGIEWRYLLRIFEHGSRYRF